MNGRTKERIKPLLKKKNHLRFVFRLAGRVDYFDSFSKQWLHFSRGESTNKLMKEAVAGLQN